MAAWSAEPSQVSLLLSRDADITITTKSGESHAHVATHLGHLDVMANIMKHQRDVEVPNNQDLGCGMIALKHGHTELAATLYKIRRRTKYSTSMPANKFLFFYIIWGLSADFFKGKAKAKIQA